MLGEARFPILTELAATISGGFWAEDAMAEPVNHERSCYELKWDFGAQPGAVWLRKGAFLPVLRGRNKGVARACGAAGAPAARLRRFVFPSSSARGRPGVYARSDVPEFSPGD